MVVENLPLVAAYPPLWGWEPLEYETYSEELEALILKHSKKCFIDGANFNAAVGDESVRTVEDATGLTDCIKQRGREVASRTVPRPHDRVGKLIFLSRRPRTWKCRNRKASHELDGFLPRKNERSRRLKNLQTFNVVPVRPLAETLGMLDKK